MITKDGAQVSNFIEDPVLETDNVIINDDRIYISFLINEPGINIGHLFYYVKNSEELIHNLIIKGMKKGNLVHMKVLFKYFYVSVKKFINSEEIKFDFICRALSHNETYPIKNQPLDIFCRSLSKKLNILYFDEFLIKKHINEKLTYLSKINRVNQINNNYYCNKKIKLKNDPVILVIDDVITTGSSANEIIRSILNFRPEAIIYFIAISKTVDNIHANDIFFKLAYNNISNR